ncbi:MAG: uroporphyrinogen decarboxylase [Halobacteriovoraceae bacterium]|nr:uroporphyrinogen decarboxylase [Halobacteriovoraceae bacterium]MCB9095086.1 uroporphyrinogen decarboxylase [Halobacteriovoraceae bacterium]
MSIDIFENRKTVPTWFMRQAGRYHQHYQELKKKHDFMTLCKNPELACEVTLGPIQDFKFNAAILFSDLLFPLEQMGLGLSYKSGPPTLEVRLDSKEHYKKIKLVEPSKSFYQFQAKALTLLKEKLPSDVTLLGFVGAPFTLYTYATEGAHKGNLISSKQGLYDGRFEMFLDHLIPELIENMSVQAEGGADALCLFDTAAGELCFSDYDRFLIPAIQTVAKEFKKRHPNKKLVYYSKMTHIPYLEALYCDEIDVIGVDWRVDIVEAARKLPKAYIQGNIDPTWLHLPWKDLEDNLKRYRDHLEKNNFPFERWIAGLGHGVIIQTPEENVRKTVQFFQSIKNF